MRAMKLTWLAVALLAFGCETTQQPAGEPEEGIQQIGEEGEQGELGQQREPGERDQQLGQQGQVDEQDQRLGQQEPGERDQQMAQQGEMPQTIAATGTVQNVDFAKGDLTLQTQQGEQLQLKARPFDLGQVVQGDTVQVKYAEYGGDKWVMPTDNADRNLEAFGGDTELTGTVERVDQQTGKLTVKGQEIMVHPYYLQNLRQGQVVEVHYTTVEGTAWASEIAPSEEGRQQGT